MEEWSGLERRETPVVRHEDFTKVVSRVDNIEDRTLKLEWNQLDHSRVINELRSDANEINTELRAIQDTLKQIKWFAMGATALYLADSMGISNLLKMIVGG